jgi:hypothetical protein
LRSCDLPFSPAALFFYGRACHRAVIFQSGNPTPALLGSRDSPPCSSFAFSIDLFCTLFGFLPHIESSLGIGTKNGSSAMRRDFPRPRVKYRGTRDGRETTAGS